MKSARKLDRSKKYIEDIVAERKKLLHRLQAIESLREEYSTVKVSETIMEILYEKAQNHCKAIIFYTNLFGTAFCRILSIS